MAQIEKTHCEKIEKARCCEEVEVLYQLPSYMPRNCVVRCEKHDTWIFIKDTTDYASLEKEGYVF